MRILFIGGTGIISTACTRLAVERGMDLTVLNRGRRSADLPAGVKFLCADIADAAGTTRELGNATFDAVVDWIAFHPADVERDWNLFRGRTGQYIFIGSASAYQKPATQYLITESTPLANPYWEYSRNKIACEEWLMEAYRREGFPITIVRPSHTYGDPYIPLAFNSHTKPYTAVDRMRRGKKVIVPGDGSSLWVVTHNSDFAKGLVGLLGNEQAIGHAFQITSDEVLSWDQLYRVVGAAAGAEPNIVHMSSDFLGACLPDAVGGLTGDKSVSVVFDNSKIKRAVPGYCATTPLREGIRRTLAWFDADATRRQVDDEANAEWDRLIAAYDQGMNEALRLFRVGC